MKAEFDKEGILAIIPETQEEDQQLTDWYLKMSQYPARKTILFERFK